MADEIEAEIKRVSEVANLYIELKTLIPHYKSDYLDAYDEIATRFDWAGGKKIS